MKRKIKIQSRLYHNITTAVLFLVTIALVVFLFPKEGKFRHEFQKNKPWRYEDLLADYDFAILKTEEELSTEEDSILRDFSPYFRYDKNIYEEQIRRFSDNFEEKWGDHLKKYYRIKHEETGHNADTSSESLLENQKKYYYDYAINVLNTIYKKGILELTDAIAKVSEGKVSFIIVREKLAEEYDISEIYIPETADKYVEEAVDELKKKNTYEESIGLDFIEQLDIKDYVQPNIFYDPETSENIRQSMIEKVSLYRGMVQKDERIIAEGELVNTEKYNILESYKAEYEKRLGLSADFYLILIGQVIIVFISVLILFLFLFNFRKEILQNILETTFILLMILLFVFATNLVVRYAPVSSLYVIPFAILPVIIRTFYDARLALFVYLVALILSGFLVPNSFEFNFLHLIAGIVAIFSLASIQRRRQLFISAFLVLIAYSVAYFGIAVMQEGKLENIVWKNFGLFAANGLLLLSCYPLIYIFEKLFGFLSDVTLMEISDTNHPLLRQLAEKAPGTFQHSLQVANLAEEVIHKIGGRPLLVRTGALYHDIGKKDIPQFFIENQVPELNPHDQLEFDKSAELIISHVTKGVEFTKKHNLPDQVIDFIRTHHGTTKVQYFLKSYRNKFPDREIDEKIFTYSGPSPFSKEMAVVMMADSVEAASRSLKTITEEAIIDLIENIINYQIEEGQFENVDITFREITTAKQIFKEKLKNIYHARIEYPE